MSTINNVTPVETKPVVTTPKADKPKAQPKPLDLVATLRGLNVAVPEGFTLPKYVNAYRDAFRAVAGMKAETRVERAAVRDAIVKFMERAMPGSPLPTGKHTGRFIGAPVFESQNTLYLAAALANVPLANGHIMAAWRAELPNAKCDYLGRDYAWSTLSEYTGGHHNGSPVFGCNDVVGAWAKRGRKPVE